MGSVSAGGGVGVVGGGDAEEGQGLGLDVGHDDGEGLHQLSVVVQVVAGEVGQGGENAFGRGCGAGA